MGENTVRLTREELYDEVWSAPISTVARKYGLSDVGLAKICDRVRVPVPWRGYWQRKAAGQDVEPQRLGKLPAALEKELGEVVIRKRAGATGGLEPGGLSADQAQYESDAEHRIVVSAVLTDPHPLVAQAVIALRKTKPSHSGHLESKIACLAVRVSLDSVDRALCIYDALCKALEARGFGIRVEPATREGTTAATLVRIGEEDIPISLAERIESVQRPEPARPKQRRGASGYTSPWRAPEYDLVPTGKLTLRIERSFINGLRTVWRDGARQRVEQCLNSFVVALVEASEELRRRRLEQEERERQWRAEREREAGEERRRQEEAARVRALNAVLDQWERARLVRSYVAEARSAAEQSGTPLEGTAVGEWLRWAEGYAARIDPVHPRPEVPADPGPPQRTPWGY